MLLYVAGPYSAPSASEREANIKAAGAVAAELWRKGHAVICPHANTSEFVVPLGNDDPADLETYELIMRGDLMMLARCDGLVMLEGWKSSAGARREYDYAMSLNMPIYHVPALPDLHITEKRCPAQAQAFAEELGRMYRTHLSKNADYSPANILLTGEVGLATRLWDKIARILNLSGFVLRVEAGGFSQPIQASHESLDDSYRDAAVYALIGLLLRRGQWGR